MRKNAFAAGPPKLPLVVMHDTDLQPMRDDEVRHKLSMVRHALSNDGLAGIVFRGVDWFSWITAGGSSVVSLTSELGIAEVLVTEGRAWVITSIIEANRLRDEELSEGFEVVGLPWQDETGRQRFIAEILEDKSVASDRPRQHERALPTEVLQAKRRLLSSELDRYRRLGRFAAEAMTEVLNLAEPTWTEYDLAAAGARALWQRGIHPALTLAAGQDRVQQLRHPVPTDGVLGERAMLVFCARGFGLYANLSRFVYFRRPTSDELRLRDCCAQVEAAAFHATKPGAVISGIYHGMAKAYADCGFPEEIMRHHQGGTTGYLSREVVANPTRTERIELNTAVAWNPSFPGMKLEDTILVTNTALDVLTSDPHWPLFFHDGLKRPDFLVRS